MVIETNRHGSILERLAILEEEMRRAFGVALGVEKRLSQLEKGVGIPAMPLPSYLVVDKG